MIPICDSMGVLGEKKKNTALPKFVKRGIWEMSCSWGFKFGNSYEMVSY